MNTRSGISFIIDSPWEFLSQALMGLIEWIREEKRCKRHSRDQSGGTHCVFIY